MHQEKKKKEKGKNNYALDNGQVGREINTLGSFLE